MVIKPHGYAWVTPEGEYAGTESTICIEREFPSMGIAPGFSLEPVFILSAAEIEQRERAAWEAGCRAMWARLMYDHDRATDEETPNKNQTFEDWKKEQGK